MLGDPPDPKYGNCHEPQRHDRTKGPADAGGALRLDREQRDQDQHRSGNHIRRKRRGGDVQAFQRRQHGYRRRNGPVAVHQRGAEQADRDNCRSRPSLHPEKRQKRENAAFAIIIDAHCDRHILERGHDDQGPDHQRKHAENRGRVGRAAGQAHNRLQRIERAGPDVAEDHAQSRKAEGRQASRDSRARCEITRCVRQAAKSSTTAPWADAGVQPLAAERARHCCRRGQVHNAAKSLPSIISCLRRYRSPSRADHPQRSRTVSGLQYARSLSIGRRAKGQSDQHLQVPSVW